MDLDSLLVSLYVLVVDDWWQADHHGRASRGPGRPALLADSEVLTLAILAQWPRFSSERDFWRFASAHTCAVTSRMAVYPEPVQPARASLGAQTARGAADSRLKDIAEPSAVYHVLDNTLIPAMVRVRASRRALFAGQATFGRSASKTEWVYGFKVALVVSPEGAVTSFGLAPAASDERPIGDALLAEDRHDAYLADKGLAGVE
jgi:hypothetical protein